MSKQRFEIDITGGILDLEDTNNMYCLNDSEICKLLNKQDEQITILEKALELACGEILNNYCSDYCGTEKDCENCWWRDFYTAEHFKTKVKELDDGK